MLPFYYPTTVAIIDDDQTFLDSFSFYFGDEFDCSTFMCPVMALNHILDQEALRRKAHVFYSDLNRADLVPQDHPADRLICWKASQIYEILQDSKRFQHFSVAIIDYDMPGMTGLELCRHIADFPVRKILLTGKTGIETAITAFNEGLIDCFLTKQDPKLTERIRYEIKRLQKNYFNCVTGPIKAVQVIKDINFLDDANVETEFADLIRNKTIEEYYLSSHPPGLLLVQENGTAFFMLIYNQERQLAHVSHAKGNNAPQELITLLESGRVLSLFNTDDGYYQNNMKDNWSRCVWPAQDFSDEASQWRYTVIDSDSLKLFFDYTFFSYADYKKLYGL